MFVTAVDLAGRSRSDVAIRQTVKALNGLDEIEVMLLSPVPSDGLDLMFESQLPDLERLPPRA